MPNEVVKSGLPPPTYGEQPSWAFSEQNKPKHRQHYNQTDTRVTTAGGSGWDATKAPTPAIVQKVSVGHVSAKLGSDANVTKSHYLSPSDSSSSSPPSRSSPSVPQSSYSGPVSSRPPASTTSYASAASRSSPSTSSSSSSSNKPKYGGASSWATTDHEPVKAVTPPTNKFAGGQAWQQGAKR